MKHVKFVLTVFVIIAPLLCFGIIPAKAADLTSSQQTKILNISIPWSENQGQLDKSVKYSANTFMGTVFITDNGSITYSLTEKSPVTTAPAQGGPSSPVIPADPPAGGEGSLSGSSKSVVIKEIPQFKITPTITGEEKTETKTNYFIGSDKSKWQSNVSTYNIVSLGNIYPNIKLQLKAHGNNVEKLYTVSPNGNPNDIKMKVEGAKKLTITKDGQLKVDVKGAKPIYFTKPIAYQDINGKRINVSVKYKLNKNTYSFILGKYNKEYPLIIDPELSVVSASTYLGGSGMDAGRWLVFDSSNNLYLVGNVDSTNFPTTTGVVSTTYKGGTYDAFISKISSDLTTLSASTYLGGTGSDAAYSISLTASGEVYIAGWTSSNNFPTTAGVVSTTYAGGSYDVFISKLSADLTTLSASTYLGGSGSDSGYSLALDSLNNVFVTGKTASTNFPITIGVVSSTFGGGGSDIFVSKLSSDLTAISASTYLGGTGTDIANVLVLDNNSNNLYIIGDTASTDFPTTMGVVSTTNAGGAYDTFISKLSTDLTTLSASTYLGGAGTEYGRSLKIDSEGNIYVVGMTASTDFPTTVGVKSDTYGGGGFDAYVSKLSSDLTTLSASTYLGGSGVEFGYSLALDSSSNVYVVGSTDSTNFPVTSGAVSTTFGGGSGDAYVSKFTSDLTTLSGSTYLGGAGMDYAIFLAIDSLDNVFVIGPTASANFPTTAGVVSTTNAGGSSDIFITKYYQNPLPTITALSPASAMINDILTPITLTVVGTGFVPSTTVTFNGHVEATTYVSPTEITAVIPVSDLGVYDATLTVTVSSPLPGGGTSNSASFITGIRSGSSGPSYSSVSVSTPSVVTPSTPVVSQPTTPVTTPVTPSTDALAKASAAGCPTLPAGTMVKVTGKPAIYSINNSLQVLYFPSGDEFKSWNSDEKYTGYQTITQDCFDALSVPSTFPVGVNYRPGSYIVKRPSSDQLYVVEPNNTLSKITDTDAKALYGQDYTTKIISDIFWPNYVNRGADITNTAHQGLLINKDNKTHYVDANNTLREVTDTGMTANRFKQAFIRTVSDSYLNGFLAGLIIDSLGPVLVDRSQ